MPPKRGAWLEAEFEKHYKKASANAASNAKDDAAIPKGDIDAAKDEFEDDFADQMTPEQRRQWEEFRAIYKGGRQRYEAAHKAGTPTTRPRE